MPDLTVPNQTVPDLTVPSPGLADPVQDEPADKIVAAQLRAAPLERLLDYGLAAADALCLRQRVRQGWSWDAAALRLTDAHLAASDAAAAEGLAAASAQHLLAASVSASVAQLMMAGDGDRRREIYRLSASARDSWLASLGDRAGHLDVPGAGTQVSAVWLRPPGDGPTPVVAIWGGTSGWGIVYQRCARALLDAGLAVALVELPGQGTPRLAHGTVLGPALYGIAACLIEALREAWFSTGQVGIWGQSMGGLLAAQIASRVPGVGACCVTSGPAGSPWAAGRPSARQRQLWADMLGCTQDDAPGRAAQFGFAPGQRIGGPVLVVHGGRDPLVSDTEAAAFAAAGTGPRRLVTWPDEGHCVYGRAAERDTLVAAWFRDVLA